MMRRIEPERYREERRRILDEARKLCAARLIDEADSLVGKRSEMKDA